MITHASQITFNDVILCENEQEYKECLEIIEKQGYDYWYLGGFENITAIRFVQFPLKTVITDLPNYKTKTNDIITPAQYFINANKPQTNDTGN